MTFTKSDAQVCLSTFLTVALLGFQSQAVIHGKYGLTAASCIPSVLMRMPWLGMEAATP